MTYKYIIEIDKSDAIAIKEALARANKDILAKFVSKKGFVELCTLSISLEQIGNLPEKIEANKAIQSILDQYHKMIVNRYFGTQL